MEYDIQSTNVSFKLRLHIQKGLANQARANLACSKDDRFKLVVPTSENAEFIYVETHPSGPADVPSVIKEFESRFAIAREELIKADKVFEALQIWREYRYGPKKREG